MGSKGTECRAWGSKSPFSRMLREQGHSGQRGGGVGGLGKFWKVQGGRCGWNRMVSGGLGGNGGNENWIGNGVCDQIKMRSLGWALIPCDRHLYGKGRDTGKRHVQKKAGVGRTQSQLEIPRGPPDSVRNKEGPSPTASGGSSAPPTPWFQASNLRSCAGPPSLGVGRGRRGALL